MIGTPTVFCKSRTHDGVSKQVPKPSRYLLMGFRERWTFCSSLMDKLFSIHFAGALGMSEVS